MECNRDAMQFLLPLTAPSMRFLGTPPGVANPQVHKSQKGLTLLIAEDYSIGLAKQLSVIGRRQGGMV
eukprot:1149469-Pelagomonas_calceolata.AAC.6